MCICISQRYADIEIHTFAHMSNDVQWLSWIWDDWGHLRLPEVRWNIFRIRLVVVTSWQIVASAYSSIKFNNSVQGGIFFWHLTWCCQKRWPISRDGFANLATVGRRRFRSLGGEDGKPISHVNAVDLPHQIVGKRLLPKEQWPRWPGYGWFWRVRPQGHFVFSWWNITI